MPFIENLDRESDDDLQVIGRSKPIGEDASTVIVCAAMDAEHGSGLERQQVKRSKGDEDEDMLHYIAVRLE